MAVYVDDMEAEFGSMIMCHMIADTRRELLDMADKIGVKRQWIQKFDNHGEHFDISKGKRALAVRYGAVEITWRECGEMNKRRRHWTADEVAHYKGL